MEVGGPASLARFAATSTGHSTRGCRTEPRYPRTGVPGRGRTGSSTFNDSADALRIDGTTPGNTIDGFVIGDGIDLAGIIGGLGRTA